MKSGTDAVGLGHNPILADTTADAITGVLPGIHNQMPIHITLTMTPHIRDHPHTEALQLTL